MGGGSAQIEPAKQTYLGGGGSHVLRSRSLGGSTGQREVICIIKTSQHSEDAAIDAGRSGIVGGGGASTTRGTRIQSRLRSFIRGSIDAD